MCTDVFGEVLSPDTIGSDILDKSETEKMCGNDVTLGVFFRFFPQNCSKYWSKIQNLCFREKLLEKGYPEVKCDLTWNYDFIEFFLYFKGIVSFLDKGIYVCILPFFKCGH